MATDQRIIVPTALAQAAGTSHIIQPDPGIITLAGLQPPIPLVGSYDGFFTGGVADIGFEFGQSCAIGEPGVTECDAIHTDDLKWNTTPYPVGGQYTEVVTAASNPHGNGSYGCRFWIGDGRNSGTGSVRANFSTNGTPGAQPELWVRWHQRWQSGFRWNSLGYDKYLYMYTPGNAKIIPGVGFSNFQVGMLGGGESDLEQDTYSWFDLITNDGVTSDGFFHVFEIYIKMDTNSLDGVIRFWVDDILVVDRSGLDISGGDAASRQGIQYFDFEENQNDPGNAGTIGSPAYVDYDDMRISRVTPPAVHSGSGYDYIGPLNGFTGGS